MKKISMLILIICCCQSNYTYLPNIDYINYNTEEIVNLSKGEFLMLALSPSDCSACYLNILDILSAIKNNNENKLPIYIIIEWPQKIAIEKFVSEWKDNYKFNIYYCLEKELKLSIGPKLNKPILAIVRDNKIIKKAVVGIPEDENKVYKILDKIIGDEKCIN